MKKVINIIIAFLLVFAFIGISIAIYVNTNRVNDESDELNAVRITAEDAENLCYTVMGVQDETTGFPFSFGVTGVIEHNGKEYYAIRASWLVNNSHMSYIGDFFVSVGGNEIYSGYFRDGSYTFEELIWIK